jgi:4-amino-4-deoxy-L-arabinose transferase-like glycosyltransferase
VEQARNSEDDGPAAGSAKESTNHSFRHSVLFIVLAAFLLRLAIITVGHTYRITPRRDHFQFGWEMGRLARSIAEGQGFSSPTDLASGPSAWAAPVYPYILGAVFKAFGIYSPASAWVILAFNSAFAALTCWTLYRLAERVCGEQGARVAAWTWAVFPYLIYWPVRVVWEASFTAFLLSLAIWLTVSMADHSASSLTRRRDWIFLGLVWGLIALTNTTILILLPFSLAWLIYQFPASSRRVSGAAICLLMVVLSVTLWTARNFHTFGRFIFVRDNLALELHEANNDESSGLWTRSEHPGNDPAAMRRFQELGEIGFMDEKRQQVGEFIREHPATFARYSVGRVWYFWAAPPQATLVGGYDLRVARHAAFFLAPISAFAGLIVVFRRRNPYRWLLAPFLLIYPLPYYLVNPFPRYKHPIEPVMLILIVYALREANKVELSWSSVRRSVAHSSPIF